MGGRLCADVCGCVDVCLSLPLPSSLPPSLALPLSPLPFLPHSPPHSLTLSLFLSEAGCLTASVSSLCFSLSFLSSLTHTLSCSRSPFLFFPCTHIGCVAHHLAQRLVLNARALTHFTLSLPQKVQRERERERERERDRDRERDLASVALWLQRATLETVVNSSFE